VSEPSLRQDAQIDHPGLVGARWWQDSVVDPIGRRKTLLMLLAAGGGIGIAGLVIDACDPTKHGRRPALALQREYGWSFGAATESLVFNGQSTEPFNAGRLDQMAKELAPRVGGYLPFYVPTLFEALTAVPRSVSSDDPTPIPPLKSVLLPVLTDSMKKAFKRAQSSAGLLASVAGTALVVDLNGEDSVAFAAGACSVFDPVFLFDNWPHPRGVVASHMTLAAAAYYQPMFAEAQRSPAPASAGGAAGTHADVPPLFVLDDQRLAFYADAAEKFDNRWVARMPSAHALKALGITRLVYVAPYRRMPWELDDLNDDLVADHAAGISIVAIDLNTIDLANVSAPPANPQAVVLSLPPLGVSYAPVPRRSPFSSGAPGEGRPTPPDFGSVPVVLGLLGGALLGVAWSRSGTWNRSGGSGGG
jgi:hypothetical protein